MFIRELSISSNLRSGVPHLLPCHVVVLLLVQMAGGKVELRTFKNWQKENVIGHELTEDNGTQYVTKVWCKICRNNEKAIELHRSC